MRRRSLLLLVGLPTLALVALSGAVYSIAKSNFENRESSIGSTHPSDDEKKKAVVSRIGAEGLVEPVSELISIGTNISGIVREVFVQPGTVVKAGDSLFELDQRLFDAELIQKQSDLAIAEAKLEEKKALKQELLAEVQVARSVVGAVQAELDDVQDLARIASQLKNGSVISKREQKRRKIMFQRGKARLAEAQAKLAKANARLLLLDEARNGASIAVEASMVEGAKAAVEVARIRKDLSRVNAPRDGTILQINIRAGEFAMAGHLDKALLTMGDLSSLNIRVNIDEADIHRYKTGARAFATPQGQPDRRLSLSYIRSEPLVVPKRSLTGRIEERVDTRVLQVIYRLDDAAAYVFSGQLLDVFIKLDGESENTAVSNVQ